MLLRRRGSIVGFESGLVGRKGSGGVVGHTFRKGIYHRFPFQSLTLEANVRGSMSHSLRDGPTLVYRHVTISQSWRFPQWMTTLLLEF
jgi:hypothetical protein